LRFHGNTKPCYIVDSYLYVTNTVGTNCCASMTKWFCERASALHCLSCFFSAWQSCILCTVCGKWVPCHHGMARRRLQMHETSCRATEYSWDHVLTKCSVSVNHLVRVLGVCVCVHTAYRSHLP